MTPWTLYLAPGTCAQAVHIALLDADAPHRLQLLDFAKTEQRSPAYLAVNPRGRVPALVTGQGTLTEVPALLLFVAQSFPAAKLAPLDDPFRLAQLQSFNNYLCSTVHVAHAHRRRGARWVDDEAAIAAMQRKVPANMSDCFSHIEADWLRGPWVFGEDYSIADPYLFTVAEWLEADGVDVSRFPKVLAHRARMQARESVQRAKAAVAG
ncbi:glutathione S-transferase family protein [Ideonella sp.]|uniref:glutathione S-transferase family protein n=1 Tax=Ideonella sp. TaxID=1929293 RepID=UPI002B470B31|nr:glutathione S-transferase family protein [Ideonella sp.]HJV68213.1 glutathione S-transferase family protein [Ideonella sp.]